MKIRILPAPVLAVVGLPEISLLASCYYGAS